MWMCGRSLLLVASVLLVAGGLPAPADAQRFSLFRNAISNIKSASPVLSNVIETVQNRTATVVKNIVKYAVSRSTDDEVCYFILGCFRLDEPWISLQRPLPKPKDPSAINVNYYLHTREAPQRYHINDSPELTMTGSSYDPTKKTFFITHGFLNSGDSQWMTDLKSALLSQVDGNVFIVDWGGGAIEPNYLQAASNTRVVGRELALLSRTLIERYGANPRDFHFLGHSLGAHISGYAARNVTNVGRVTAFDPAGPGFEKLPRLVRLNKYSASFVDVLHTNAKPVTALGFGMMHPIGDVDFYMNGGVEQPGCAKPNIAPLKSILDIVALPATALGELVSCAHCRSYEYFTEAVKNTKCRMWGHKTSVARQRLSWARMIPAEVPDNRDKCEHARCAPVGLDTPDFPARGNFFVKTDSASPFCLMKDSADGQSLDELRELGYVD